MLKNLDQIRDEVVRLGKLNEAQLCENEAIWAQIAEMQADIHMISKAIGAVSVAFDELNQELNRFKTYGGKI